MIPYFDMINHHPDSKISHYYDNNDCVVLYSGSSWKANQQLYLNYGALPNSKLLMLYGFCIPPLVGNIYDCVDLYVAMSPDAPMYNQKVTVLTEMEIDQSSPFKLTVNGIPNNLLVCLRIQYASSIEDINTIRQTVNNKINNQLEQFICNMLVESLYSMLSGYNTTIEEDESLLVSWNLLEPKSNVESLVVSDEKDKEIFLSPVERLKNAVILRYGEKLILQKSIDWMKEYCTRNELLLDAFR
jgi:histone-lysine N-methyltransferase SETD3